MDDFGFTFCTEVGIRVKGGRGGVAPPATGVVVVKLNRPMHKGARWWIMNVIDRRADVLIANIFLPCCYLLFDHRILLPDYQ